MRRLCRVLVLLAAATAGRASAAPLELLTEDFPPFSFQRTPGGAVVGISTDLLQQAFQAAGMEFKVTSMPWARAYEKVLASPGSCLYSTTRTEEREPKFKWVGPLVSNDWVLFGRADGPRVTTLADAKAYSIGGYRGSAQTEFLQAQGFKVDLAAEDTLNPRKLMAKRIDFWAAGTLKGPFMAAREGVSGLVPVLELKHAELYLACNKGVDDATVAKLNEALKKLAKAGVPGALAKTYVQ